MEKVAFNLLCPTGVPREEHYLSLIKFLIDELSKYAEVEIFNKSILDEYQRNRSIQECEIMIRTYQQKLELLKKGKE